MSKKKQFKIVFMKESNSYAVAFTDHDGEWAFSSTYYSMSPADGTPAVGMLNENIIWDIQKLAWLGYQFLGVETVDAA